MPKTAHICSRDNCPGCRTVRWWMPDEHVGEAMGTIAVLEAGNRVQEKPAPVREAGGRELSG